jgi:hypothetical protein
VTATVYWTGASELATLSNTFSVDGLPTDPSTVTCIVTDPAGTQTAYSYAAAQITKTGTGQYTLNIVCNLDGLWVYCWVSAGTASDVATGTWTVLPTTIGQWYCSAEELKSRLSITDDQDDFEIQLAIQAAARSIEAHTGRYFWQAPGVRTYVPESIWNVHTDDFVSVTSLATDNDGDGVFETTWTQGTDFQPGVGHRAYNTTARGEPWPYTQIHALGSKWYPYLWPWTHQDRIQLTAVFGWPVVPPAIRMAALVIAGDLFKLREAPFGVMGGGDLGAVRVGQSSTAVDLLRPYISPNKAGV